MKTFEYLEQHGSIFKNSDKEFINKLINKTDEEIILDLEKRLEEYLHIKEFGVNSISVGIKVGDFEKVITLPNTSNENIYDVASITKFFTLKLLYELKERKLLDFNTYIKDILPLKNIGDARIIDIIKMVNTIETDGRLAEVKNEKEYLERLYTIKYTETFDAKYTDVGHALLTKVIEKVIFDKTKENLTYKDIFKKYVVEPLGLKSTMYTPDNNIFKVMGNGDASMYPHDPKTRLAGGVSGAAGIFTTSKDLFTVAKSLNNDQFFSQSFMNEIYNYSFLDEKDRRRSYSGIYLKTPNNNSSYIPDVFSDTSIAHQGYSGSIIVFDILNKIHFSILVDAIDKISNLKSQDFFKYLHKLKNEIGLYSISLYMSNKQ